MSQHSYFSNPKVCFQIQWEKRGKSKIRSLLFGALDRSQCMFKASMSPNLTAKRKAYKPRHEHNPKITYIQ